LKKDLPPSQYQVVLRDMDKGSTVLGQVSFP
jgi:hypothetical protein